MPCPQVQVHDGVLGVSTPVSRGQALTFSATSGDFGTTEGAVELAESGNPQNVFSVPASDVVWSTTPGGPSFVTLAPVPLALPAASGTGVAENWDVRITLAGANAACPKIAVKVLRSVAAPACPSQVAVNDGVVGGQNAPQSAGQLVSLVATAGSFPAGLGTATFESPTTLGGQAWPVTQPYPGKVVLWTAKLVQVEIPVSLPGFTGQAAWQLYLTPAGATGRCGPYPVHVAAAFPVPRAVVLPPSPLVRGALVTILATQGSFLTTAGTGGTVVLRRAGGNPAEWPVGGAVWTPTSIVLTVPGDLPAPATAGALDEVWEVHLTPSGAQPWGSIGTVRVLEPTPALLGVPPVAVSEREIVLVATGATAGSQVNFYANGIRFATRPNVSPDRTLPLLAPFQHLTGVAAVVRVQAPTVTELQRADAYNTNQVRMPVEVQLEDGDGDASLRLPIQLLLPPPAAGFTRRTGDVVTVEGIGASHPELGEVGSNEWLGGADRATVVIYPDGLTAADPAVPLMVGTTKLGEDYAHPTREGASAAAVTEFRKAKGATYRPVAPAALAWTEERVVVTLPPGTGSGRLVLFRDELPSRVVPFAMDLCSPTFLSGQLRDLFSVALSKARVGLGDELRVDLVQTGVQNVLADLMANRGVTVSFAYELVRGTARATADRLAGAAPAGALAAGVPLLTRFVPERAEFTVSGGSTPERTVGWTLKVTATVHGVPQTGDPTAPAGGVCPDALVPLPDLPFSVLALPVPKLALGFDGKWFGPPAPLDEGAAIFLAGGGGGMVSRSRNADVVTVLNTLVSNVRTVLAVLPNAIPNGNGVDDVLVPSINELIRCGGGNAVDTYLSNSGNIVNGLDDDLSSFVLLGAPGTTFSLFNDNDRKGTRVTMRIPGGTWIADLATMHESWASRTNSPAPNPGNGFGDMANSFSW